MTFKTCCELYSRQSTIDRSLRLAISCRRYLPHGLHFLIVQINRQLPLHPFPAFIKQRVLHIQNGLLGGEQKDLLGVNKENGRHLVHSLP